jgi:hypothetical protein
VTRADLTNITIRLAIIGAVTVAGSLWLHFTGPLPVVKVTTPTDEFVPFWYMVTAFPVLGMLSADIVDSLRTRDYRASAVLAMATCSITALSAGRLSLHLPISGHALVIGYVVALRFVRRSGPLALAELLVSAGFLMVIAYPKLVMWGDPITLGVGLGLGVLFAVVTLLATKKRGSAVPSP